MTVLAIVQSPAITPSDALASFLNTPDSWKLIGLLVLAFLFKTLFGSSKKWREVGDKPVRTPRPHKPRPALKQQPQKRPWRQPVVAPPKNVVSAAAKFKGEKGEIIVRDELAMALPPDLYHVFHDILIPTPEGSLTQMDHVVVSAFGIFVIETKHYSGWIFGKGDDPSWTIQFPDGKKEIRQNPLRQNEGHIRALSHLVNIPELYFCNLVRLTGNAEIKTGPVPGVMHSGMGEFIRCFQNPLFPIELVRQAYQQIMMADRSKCSASREEHLNFVQSRIRRKKMAA